VVTKARADVEAFVINKARQMGMDPDQISGPTDLAIGVGGHDGE